MKKTICVLLSFVILALSCFSLGLCGFAENRIENVEKEHLNSFIEGIAELSRNYQAEDKCSSENEFDFGNELTISDFKTARIIVESKDPFDDQGAVEHISGFRDFHILQYEDSKSAALAYLKLFEEPNVISVEPDKMTDVKETICKKTSSNTFASTNHNSSLCQWSKDRTQSQRLLDYLDENHIEMNDVIVGVVDSGVDYNHEFLQGRIIRTYFNASSDGVANDEMDSSDTEMCHGTAVSSVIVDNTPDNVKIRCYRVLDEDLHSMSQAAMCSGILQAINDNVDVISLSITVHSKLGKACVDEAYKKRIPVCIAIGNDGYDVESLATTDDVICVAASDKNDRFVSWNNISSYIDIAAPGEEINVATYGNTYDVWDGTSFSTPCIASLCAIMKSLDNGLTVKQIEKRIIDSSIEIENDNNYTSKRMGLCLVQFCNAVGIDSIDKPVLSLETGRYVGAQSLSISCSNPNAKIYYTTDGSFPSVENAMEYISPIVINEYTVIRSIAYYEESGYYSEETVEKIRISYLGDEEDFTITNEGVITDYKGDIGDLIIPDTINGVVVTDIGADAFNKETLYGLVLPDTIVYISDGAKFKNNSNIKFVTGNEVINIGASAFSKMSGLINVEFPKAQLIGASAFYGTTIPTAYFPSVKTILGDAFKTSLMYAFYGPEVEEIGVNCFSYNTALKEVYLPKLTRLNGRGCYFQQTPGLSILEADKITEWKSFSFEDSGLIKADFPQVETFSTNTFKNCNKLCYVNMPSLIMVPDNAFVPTSVGPNGFNYSTIREYYFDNVVSVGTNAFSEFATKRIEFSSLVTACSLPKNTNPVMSLDCCIIALPATFEQCTEDTNGRTYKIYGTAGTYAQQWANENGHQFIEVSQDTAIVQDVDEFYDGMVELSFDCIGFHKTYTWYGSYTANNTNGVELYSDNKGNFNPSAFEEYPYYYCVCTSTDKNEAEIFEHQELIYSRVCENIDYADADYTQYNAAVEQANSLDSSLYKDLDALDEALAKDVSQLPSSMQSVVDEATQAILNAINALEYKDADYSAYNAAVEKANALDRSLYKDLTALDEALAVDVSCKNITEQDIVDNQTQAIFDAIYSLELKQFEYKIIKGENSIYEQGSKKDLIIVSNADFEKFSSVEIDGETVGTNNYIAEAGSTKITLKYSYLDKLPLEEHSISIISSDGRASTTFTVKQVSESTTESTTEPQSEPESTTKKSPETTAENVTESSNQNKKTTDTHYVPDDEKSPRTGNGEIGSTVCCFTLLLSSACLLYVIKRKD